MTMYSGKISCHCTQMHC